MDRIRFISYRGRQILLIDLTNLDSTELFAAIERVREVITSQPPGSVLCLGDFTGARVDRAVATRMKEVLVFDRPHVKRTAWIGTEGMPKAFYESFKAFSQRELPVFKSREEALEWLVGNEEAAKAS